MFVDCNAVLKLKFQGLHSTVADNVNAADVIDFLFREKVLGEEDRRTLHHNSDPRQQCCDLLALLQTSENPQTFVHLYRAISNEPHLQWLIDQVDEYSDQLVVNLLTQQWYASDPTGKRLFHLSTNSK